MSIRLLLIANPLAYHGSVTDIPLSYARLAAHPDVELFHADTTAMMTDDDTILATSVTFGFIPDQFQQLVQQPCIRYRPEEFDVAFCRTLKPFPDGYLAHLRRWSERLRFVNDPAGITRQLDPDFFLAAAGEFTPPMVRTDDVGTATAFAAMQGDIVAKRANSCGGRGVYRIRHVDGGYLCDNVIEGESYAADFPRLFNRLADDGREKLLLMRYLPRVIEGDRRIIVVDGEIYGAYLRVSPEGHWIQNVSYGAGCELMPVEARDREIVAATCQPYLDAGIHVLGYDLLQDDKGEWIISEINAGNIGGLFRIEYLGVPGVTDRFVNWLHDFHHGHDPDQRSAIRQLSA